MAEAITGAQRELERLRATRLKLFDRLQVDAIPAVPTPWLPLPVTMNAEGKFVLRAALLPPSPDQRRSHRSRLVGVMFDFVDIVLESHQPFIKIPETRIYRVNSQTGHTSTEIIGEGAILEGVDTIDPVRALHMATNALVEAVGVVPAVDSYERIVRMLKLEHSFVTPGLNS